MEDFQITPDIHKSLLQGYLFGIDAQPPPSTTLNDLPLEVRALIIDCLDTDKDDFSIWNVMHISRSWYNQNAIGPWAEKKWQHRIRTVVLGRADTARVKKSKGCKTWRQSYVYLIRSRCMSCKRQKKLRSYRALLNNACGWLGVCEPCPFRDPRFQVIHNDDRLLSYLKKEEIALLRFRTEGSYEHWFGVRYLRTQVLGHLVAKRLRLLNELYDMDVVAELSDEDWDVLNKAIVCVIVAAEPFSCILQRHVLALLHGSVATMFQCTHLIIVYYALQSVAAAAAELIAAHNLPSQYIRNLANWAGNGTTWWDCLHIGTAQMHDFLNTKPHSR